MNKGLKAHVSHRPVSVIFPKGVPFSLFRNNDILIVGERRKRGRIRTEPPKRTKGSLRCMVSTDRSTHLPSFRRRAGCHTRQELPAPIAHHKTSHEGVTLLLSYHYHLNY